ncbi:TniB family NTP-binding protein [Dongshaea marina]|uniref:TniB family NTP-binding protein n=1 Tax=Dongshaea marina TaxID=2047966 RepID=UPI000D3E5B04|nr:TniB family NTP-binding protein [Dongshaea marina]
MFNLNKHIEDIRAFKECTIEYPMLKTVINDFDELRFNFKIGNNQQCMMLTGDTGAGKSHLIRYYKSKNNEYNSNRGITIPVLFSRISDKGTLIATLAQLLKDLGQFNTPYREKLSSDLSLTESLIKLLDKCKTELIIIKEFQELIEFKSVKQRQAIGNRLKYISEKTGIPMVFSGMPWTKNIMEDPQWRSRIIIHRNLEYFKLSGETCGESNSQIYIQLLASLEDELPVKTTPSLKQHDIAFPLFAICKGEFRQIKLFLEKSLIQAYRDNKQVLDKETMNKTYKNIYPGKTSPSDLDINKLIVWQSISESDFNCNAEHEYDSMIPTIFEKTPLSQILKKK